MNHFLFIIAIVSLWQISLNTRYNDSKRLSLKLFSFKCSQILGSIKCKKQVVLDKYLSMKTTWYSEESAGVVIWVAVLKAILLMAVNKLRLNIFEAYKFVRRWYSDETHQYQSVWIGGPLPKRGTFSIKFSNLTPDFSTKFYKIQVKH